MLSKEDRQILNETIRIIKDFLQGHEDEEEDGALAIEFIDMMLDAEAPQPQTSLIDLNRVIANSDFADEYNYTHER